VIATLSITLLVESLIVIGFAAWFKKPTGHLLLSSIAINILTQGMLWALLLTVPRHYLLTLFIAEVCIWVVEGTILHLYPYNRLMWREALSLSLIMNLASFGIGWVLPV
jgi:hypothetical protein